MENHIFTIPSLTAAAAFLLQNHPALANSTPLTLPDPHTADPKIEPLILQPPLNLSETLFAAHRSHSSHASHASHASHYSGVSSRYYAPSPVPAAPYPSYNPIGIPSPAPAPAPLYYPPNSAPAPLQTADPANPPLTSQGLKPNNTKIQLTDGAIFFGTIEIKAPTGIGFTALNGKYYKIPRALLSPATLTALQLPPAS